MARSSSYVPNLWEQCLANCLVNIRPEINKLIKILSMMMQKLSFLVIVNDCRTKVSAVFLSELLGVFCPPVLRENTYNIYLEASSVGKLSRFFRINGPNNTSSHEEWSSPAAIYKNCRLHKYSCNYIRIHYFPFSK